mmetsp:Transcript_4927/g.12450  ORF Transcript_4927/g.12450 Transcript_4927/m.12450 type:complete len:202 (-) Transcript_4927:1445-2050(-)
MRSRGHTASKVTPHRRRSLVLWRKTIDQWRYLVGSASLKYISSSAGGIGSTPPNMLVPNLRTVTKPELPSGALEALMTTPVIWYLGSVDCLMVKPETMTVAPSLSGSRSTCTSDEPASVWCQMVPSKMSLPVCPLKRLAGVLHPAEQAAHVATCVLSPSHQNLRGRARATFGAQKHWRASLLATMILGVTTLVKEVSPTTP